MIPAVRLGLRLAWRGAREQRLRAASVAAAVLLGTVLLLGTAAIARADAVLRPEVYRVVENQRLLAVVVASIVFPVLVLAATVARLSAGLRDRRMANLRLLGMGSGGVRLAVAVEMGASAAIGALVGVLVFLLVRPLLVNVNLAGRHWPSSALWPPGWSYAAVVLALPLVAMAVGVLPPRLDMRAALNQARRADERRPAWWRMAPIVVGTALCLYVIRANPTHGLGNSVIVALFAGVSLLGLGMVPLVPVFVRLLADLMLHLSSRPTVTIAARRLQAQPAGLTRVVSGLLIALFLIVGARAVVVSFESTPQYREASAQLHREQRATVRVPRARVDAALAKAQRVPEVRAAYAFPTLSTRCGMNQDLACLTAIVATCAELRAISPALQGCVRGEPMTLLSQWDPDHPPAELPPLFPTRRGTPRPHSTALRVPAPKQTIGGDPADFPDRDPAAQLHPLYANIVLPPHTPGVRPLVKKTEQLLLVTAEPGRTLADDLATNGLGVESSADLADYDFVALLRALVWSIATVILSVGLLAFAIAALDRAVTRRREVTALQLVGAPRAVLRRTQWIEAALPLALGCALAIGLGLLAGGTFLSLNSDHLPLPWSQSVWLALVGALGAVLVGGLTVVASSPRISPDLIRHE